MKAKRLRVSNKVAKDAALEDMLKDNVNYQIFALACRFRKYPKEIIVRIKTH